MTMKQVVPRMESNKKNVPITQQDITQTSSYVPLNYLPWMEFKTLLSWMYQIWNNLEESYQLIL